VKEHDGASGFALRLHKLKSAPGSSRRHTTSDVAACLEVYGVQKRLSKAGQG
jgi:hypothetical protein